MTEPKRKRGRPRLAIVDYQPVTKEMAQRALAAWRKLAPYFPAGEDRVYVDEVRSFLEQVERNLPTVERKPFRAAGRGQ